MSRVAVIDLGTHNCRLGIAQVRPDGFDVIRVFSKIVRLGEGAQRTGGLTEGAMSRTLDALKAMSVIIADQHADKTIALATEAARISANARDFFGQVKQETGLAVKVISAREEVRLSVLAGHRLMNLQDDGGPSGKALFLDIGGGSTEVVLAERRGHELAIVDWISMPFGVVRGRDRFGPSLTRESYQGLEIEVKNAFSKFFAANRPFFRTPFDVIGTSGTVTTLAAFCLALEKFHHFAVDGTRLSIPQLREKAHTEAFMPLKLRRAHNLIGPERADFLPSGCAIFTGLLSLIPARTLIAADRGLREGVWNSLLPDTPSVAFLSKKR